MTVHLPAQPTIYEIDTWVWLNDMSRTEGRRVTLDTVPARVWDEIASFGFDAVWLMGVWQRSPAGVRVATTNESFIKSFEEALPGYSSEDVVGSPYCIRSYVVEDYYGGASALATARNELAQRNLGLILDYVPNHVAIDHPWTVDHPEYFIEPTAGSDFDRDAFVIVDKRPLALGRDPYFPPWPDVIQLNAFAPGVREAASSTLLTIAEQCDGVRCDMAMLFFNHVFEKTWGAFVGEAPADEFWPAVISSVKAQREDFVFIAEAYWDMEWDLVQEGFDYCYDKRLFDRLAHESAAAVQGHLQATLEYQQHMIRFLENHDEPRAATTFGSSREHAAAIVLALLPGAKLYHEGQFDGRRIHNPVPLGRRVDEPKDSELYAFYKSLLQFSNAHKPNDSWRMCEVSGWPDNQSCQDIVAWQWTFRDNRYLVIVNLSSESAQGMVHLPWHDLAGSQILLSGVVGNEEFKRDGSDLVNSGLFVDMNPWQSYVFDVLSS